MLRINSFKPVKSVLLLFSGGLCALLAGCTHNPFSVSFNDNLLYDPNGKSSDGPLKDPALQACLNQVLMANAELTFANVTLLACPSAGVENLEGIAALESLEQLELSDNLISNISPLTSLRNLRVLSLRNNEVGNIGVLDSLPILRFVALQGNPSIPCRQLDALKDRLGNTLTLPLTCQ